MSPRVFVLFYFTAVSFASGADFSFEHSPQAGLGYTNNVAASETSRQSDTYLLLAHTSRVGQGLSEGRFSLSYKDYSEHSDYDVLNWSFGLSAPLDRTSPKWFFDVSVGGQRYTHVNPATTELAFDNKYIGADLQRKVKLSSSSDLEVGPGYQLKRYPGLSRTDHAFYGGVRADFEIKEGFLLSPFSEMGLVFSNDKLYRRNYFDLGAEVSVDLKKDWIFEAGLLLRRTGYPNRTVSDVTAISQGRGRVVRLTGSLTEAQNYNKLMTAVVHEGESFDLRGEFNLASQRTRSGNENYDELELKGSATWRF